MNDRSEQAREHVGRNNPLLRVALGDREAFLVRCAEAIDYCTAPIEGRGEGVDPEWGLADVMLAKHIAEVLGLLAARVAELEAVERAGRVFVGEGQVYIAWTCPECGKVVKGESHNVCEAPAEGGEG